ncbi:MAG TPA: DUF4342 domain-containing protein [Caldilineaceae bacterium]|nr:DUF4342 domain-containing protein [Caldilineaceae bacterium]
MSESTNKTPVLEQPTVEEPTTDGAGPTPEEHTWVEEIEIAGSQLVDRVKELVAQGNVRRLILRTQEGKVILEIPLTAGAVLGGLVTIFAPLWAALGALAALIAQVKVEVVRSEGGKE